MEAEHQASGTGQTASETALQVESDEQLRVPYYCEENVWRLAYRRMHQQPEDRFYIVFISNSIKAVPMFQQRAASEANKSCCWDYHVLLLCVRALDSQVVVYDMDTRLPYPCPLLEYLQQSFPYQWPLPYAPMFRLVDANLFLQYFSSDRSHMFNQQTQQWNAPPPTYECILNGPPNLQDYLNFVDRPRRQEVNEQALGTMLSLDQLAHYNFSLD